MRHSLDIELATEDVGSTQVITVSIGSIITVSIGSTVIGRWHTHTRYDDTSYRVAEAAIAQALKPLIEQGFKDAICEPYVERQDEEDF